MPFRNVTQLWRPSSSRPEYSEVAPEDKQVPLEHEEGPSPADDIAALRQSLRRLKRWLLFTTIISILGFLFLARGEHFYVHMHLPASLQWGRTPIPDFAMIKKSFNEEAKYATFDNSADHLWHGLIPAGNGFVTVPYPSIYHLPKTESDEPGHHGIYTVSVFHQLHCLVALRHHIVELQAAGGSHNTTKLRKLKDMGWHVNHCLDFIRQALICNADTTLEHVKKEPGKPITEIQTTGDDDLHSCKNWDAIAKWTKDNAWLGPRDYHGPAPSGG